MDPRISSQGEAYDATDPEAEKKARDIASLREASRRRIEQALLGTEEGRDWLWEFLTNCHFTGKRIAMSGNYEQGFFDGQREIGFGLVRRLARSAPDGFAAMISEFDK